MISCQFAFNKISLSLAHAMALWLCHKRNNSMKIKKDVTAFVPTCRQFGVVRVDVMNTIVLVACQFAASDSHMWT